MIQIDDAHMSIMKEPHYTFITELREYTLGREASVSCERLTKKEICHNRLELDIRGKLSSHYEIILWEMMVLRNIPVPDSRHRCCELTCQQYPGHALIYTICLSCIVVSNILSFLSYYIFIEFKTVTFILHILYCVS